MSQENGYGGAAKGNRTLVPSLEGWYTSRCMTAAYKTIISPSFNYFV